MRMCATRCMPPLSGCSSQSHWHWERGGGYCSPFRVFPCSSGASSTRKKSCAEIFGGTRNIAKGCVIGSFRIFGKSSLRHCHHFQQMTIRILEVKTASATTFVDLHIGMAEGPTAVRNSFGLDSVENRFE